MPRLERGPRRPLLLFAALLTATLLESLGRAFTMVFVLNFSTAGPGPSALLVLLLASGFVLPLGVYRWWPLSRRALSGLVAASALALVVSLVEVPLVAALAAAVVWLAATPVVFWLVGAVGARLAVAAAVGVALRVAARAWLDTATPYALPAGWALLVVGAGLLVAVWAWALRAGASEGASAREGVPRWGVVALVAFVVVEYAFLGLPGAVAAWHGGSVVQATGAVALGLLLGALASVSPLAAPRWAAPWAVAFAAALGAVLWLGAVPLAALVAQVAAVALLAVALRGGPVAPPERAGLDVGLAQLLLLALLFLHVSAGNWAFMPGPVAAITHGRAAVYLWLTALPLAVAAVAAPARNGAPPPRRARGGGAASPWLAGCLAAVLVVAVAGAVVTAERGAPGPGPAALDGGAVTVMTYNVHQFYSEGQTGRHNLAQVARVIEASGAQVVGLQESEGARLTSGGVNGVRWLAHALGMHYYYGPPTAAQVYGVALLSEWPITEARWEWLPAEESVERVAVVATVEAPAGPLHVIVTHFQTPRFAADRAAQAERVVALAEPFDRAVVLGDFNTEPDASDAAYATLDAAFTDAWRAAPGRGPGYTADAGEPTRRIDHVWLKGQWRVDACEVLGGPRASDHRGVACAVAPAP